MASFAGASFGVLRRSPLWRPSPEPHWRPSPEPHWRPSPEPALASFAGARFGVFRVRIAGMVDAPHIPVMLRQSMEMLQVQPGKIWVDATAGAGGHLREIIRRGGAGSTIVAVDQDIHSLDALRRTITDEFANGTASEADIRFAHSNFGNLEQILDENNIDTVSGGILADLGVSSMQLDQAERGFSFSKDGPLDMRMNTTSGITAERLVNTLPEHELADIIYKYGEERLSRQIAHRIV